MFENTVSLAVKTRRHFAAVFACWGKPQTPVNSNPKERHGMSNESTDGLKRPIQIKFRVTEAERDLIHEKMRQLGTNNLAAYMRKISIDGYVINTDNTDLKAIAAEMQKIGVNINQIAKRVNSTSRIYEQDFTEIRGKVNEIWQLLRLSLSRAR
jgi:hypothetical protein